MQSDIAEMLITRAQLKHKISLRNFKIKNGGDVSGWIDSVEARDLFQQTRACEIYKELCNKQFARSANAGNDPSKAMNSVFANLYMKSPLAFAFGKGELGKKRERDIQTKFRDELIDQHGARQSDPLNEGLGGIWCPVIGKYFSSREMIASHLFPFRYGQATMDVIFGSQPEPELLSTSNGLMLHHEVERQLDQGNLVIVPDLPNNPSDDAVRRWHQAARKEYKIRLTDIKSEKMGKRVDFRSKETWLDLDGVKLSFKTDVRPRARYLYFLYCAAMLKRSWTTVQASDVLRDELGQKYWGTAGEFMKKNQLLGFVESMGHDYEELLEGAIEEPGVEEADEAALAVVTHEIVGRRTEEDEDESQDESEDDED